MPISPTPETYNQVQPFQINHLASQIPQIQTITIWLSTFKAPYNILYGMKISFYG